MATIVLQAAGAFIGGALGPVGSAIGSAAGAMAGYMIDRALIEGTRRVEGPRLGAMRPFMAEEGAPVARVYGTARLGGKPQQAQPEGDQLVPRKPARLACRGGQGSAGSPASPPPKVAASSSATMAA